MGEIKKVNYTIKPQYIKISGNKKYLITKRIVDCIGSIIGIILFSPAFLIIPVVIKLEDGGPIIFKQKRIGYRGECFHIYKFRSMRIDAEQLKENLVDQNEIEGAMFKIKDDPRVTRFGKFIRRHSLDELPQFFNVFLGNMSLVGPRPPLANEVKKYSDYEKQRLFVQPGLSGLWQISGRNNLSFSDMVELDLQYIQSRSTALDIKIIFKTIWNIAAIKKNGAY